MNTANVLHMTEKIVEDGENLRLTLKAIKSDTIIKLNCF